MIYSEKVLQRFQQPLGVATESVAADRMVTHCFVEHSDAAHGDRVRLQYATGYQFNAWGSPATIACADYLCEMANRQQPVDVAHLCDALALTPEQQYSALLVMQAFAALQQKQFQCQQ